MKGFRVLSLIAVAAVALGTIAQAKEKKTEGATPRRRSIDYLDSYGLAGCGLGSVLIGSKPGKIQIVVATLNDIIVPQTFAITSGTLNCDIPEMGQKAAVFIEVNKEIVKKDAARGAGESLDSLSEILGCQNQSAFNQMMQTHFEVIFKQGNSAYDSTRFILELLKADQHLAAQCQVLG